MGKIGKLTGKNGGSRVTIYPITIPQAVVDPTTKKKLRDELDEIKQAAAGGIEEAPKDGKYYARKNGAWADVNATVLTLTINTNQSSHTDVANVKATVTYGGTSKQMGNGDTLNLTMGTTYTIIFPEVANYKKPDDITFTVESAGMVAKVGTYKTEVVTVSVTSEDSSSVAGQVVTINGSTITLTASGVATKKIPFGTEYSVSVSTRDGYMNPSTQTFTASQASRAVAMVYETKKLGVFIQDINGKLWNVDDWDTSNNANANGVAVITDNVSVIVALNDSDSKMQIAGSNTTRVETYCTEYPLEQYAKLDYEGKTNTSNILKAVSSTSYAAGWCNNYTFPDGITKGHLPSAGEFYEVNLNRDNVNTALAKCGGSQLQTAYYQTSTYFGFDTEDKRSFWGLAQSGFGYGNLLVSNYVRPFSNIELL